MGCCNGDKNCEKDKKKTRPVPWFSITIGILVLLVIFNWQA